jgi:hypothetical protein
MLTVLRTPNYSLQSSRDSAIKRVHRHHHHTTDSIGTPNSGSKGTILQHTNFAESSRSPSQQSQQIFQSHPQRPEHTPHARGTSQRPRSYDPYQNPILDKQTYQMNRFLDEVPDFRMLAVLDVESERESERLLRWKYALRKRVVVLEDSIGVL